MYSLPVPFRQECTGRAPRVSVGAGRRASGESCGQRAFEGRDGWARTLKGTLVETSDTKTPTLSWFCRILYALQLMRLLLTCVATSAPPSKSSGMRLAKRYTVIPGLASRPPRHTPASTMSGWPSCAQTVSWKVATSSGRSSFMMPSRRLYSPTGERQSPGGASNLASRIKWASCQWAHRSRVRESRRRAVATRLELR